MEVADDGSCDGLPSRTARWVDGYYVPTPDLMRLRTLHWARQAVALAGARSEATRSDAFATWTAAVEAVWWVAALDDLLDKIVGPAVYRPVRNSDDCGRVVHGLRWLRHLPIHELSITGAGGPKRPFFPPPGANYVIYISPLNRWLPSHQLRSLENERNPEQRDSYDAVVAGWPLSTATERALVWHDRVVSACGFPDYVEPDDTTVL